VTFFFASRFPRLVLVLAGVLVVGVLVWAGFVVAGALPSRHVVMTTGPQGESDYELGMRYRAILARQGVDLRIAASAGKLENLDRLRNPKSGYSVGLVAGGVTGGSAPSGVVSLGTLGYDPLWIFCRDVAQPQQLGEFAGKRVSVGPEGSATRALLNELLRLNGLQAAIRPVALSPRAGADALRRGEIDCACMLASPDAPEVRLLLADERIDVMSFPRADAYVALFPVLRKFVLPMGVANLATNRPPRDVVLVGDAQSLLVRDDVHPAIQYLLLQAAEEIHSRAGIFQKAGQYPAPEPVDVPLSAEAHQFYKSGGTFLQRHLPFWLWVFASRLIVALVPLLGVIYPLARLIPAAIGFEVDRRLNLLYADLRGIEARMEEPNPPREELEAEWRRLEERIRTTHIPRRYTRAVYTLKQHAKLVRDRLARLDADSPG